MSGFDDESSVVSRSDDEADSDESFADAGLDVNSSNDESISFGANYREVKNMTKRENENVETMRDLVTGVLVITASFISISAFIFLSRNETDAFRLAVR
jgi:hypothetical protein